VEQVVMVWNPHVRNPYVRNLYGPVAAACVIFGAPAFAQTVPTHPPELDNRIPAPLPPPPRPPVINGPLNQGPAPGVYQPPRLNTHSDRTIRCQERGLGAGLRGGELDSFVRSCVNAN
jgi:hypothetical protein